MSVKVKMEGLLELEQELLQLPAALTDQARTLVYATADAAANEMRAAYPVRTGNLRRGVTVRRRPKALVASATVANRAPHALIFELGTQVRHTKIGANRGSMPPGHVFFPIYYRRRRTLMRDIMALIKNQGLKVSGDAA